MLVLSATLLLWKFSGISLTQNVLSLDLQNTGTEEVFSRSGPHTNPNVFLLAGVLVAAHKANILNTQQLTYLTGAINHDHSLAWDQVDY
jgi:hypothetical protein